MSDLPLCLGDQGQRVREWRSMLARLGYTLEVEDLFDIATENATRRFQKDRGLADLGVVDELTWQTAAHATEPTMAAVKEPS